MKKLLYNPDDYADQTLDALKTPGHPYRAALETAFGGNVRVLGIDERRQMTPQDLATAAHVFVATVQSFRVANAAQRNVYKDDENYEAFFKDRALPEPLPTMRCLRCSESRLSKSRLR